MEKKNKVIILILIVIIVIPLAYFAISEYFHDLEEKTFYNSIKEISDIENKTDAEGNIINNQTISSIKDLKNYDIKSINTTSTEILMLEDLKTKVSNESYIEYIDIQLNRLNAENRTYTSTLAADNIHEEYLNGTKGVYEALSLMEDKNKESKTYVEKIGEYKVEADSFLTTHPDMKDKLYELGIDEDFLYNQIEEYKNKTTFTK